MLDTFLPVCVAIAFVCGFLGIAMYRYLQGGTGGQGFNSCPRCGAIDEDHTDQDACPKKGSH